MSDESATTITPLDPEFFTAGRGPWQERLAFVVEMMREMSRQTDPQEMVKAYGRFMDRILEADRFVSISRRDLAAPWYRITRSDLTDPNESINPWKERDRLPLHDRGLLSELIYGDEPRIIDDLSGLVAPDDPAAAQFDGMRSLLAIPNYDNGVAQNMVVMMMGRPSAFRPDSLPERVWMSNLFGRGTQNLVLRDEIQKAYDAVDRELQVVADIQRSLLPTELPTIPTLELAAHYQTSTRAGGDYYDFFPMPDGRWGILIADVSGHGTPAAVMMAVTHSIAHMHNGPPDPPSELLGFINRHLAARYTNGTGSFVTAFYGIYDPKTRQLTYASGGHPVMRIRRDGSVGPLDAPRRFPLGIEPDEVYADATITFAPGDLLVLYTDGITEAKSVDKSDLFGQDRLDDVLRASDDGAKSVIHDVLEAVDAYSGYRAPDDDRTLLVAKVS
ncbi:MAG: PP2C family protein-serine/threonine phosphatase [Tepidisphaeraceae bacterium]